MKIVLELLNEPTNGDTLVFEDDGFKCISKDNFLGRVDKEIVDLKKENELLKQENENLKKSVNERLKEYHDILKIISKGE